MLFYGRASVTDSLDRNAVRESLYAVLDKVGPRNKVLAIPPDFTCFHSQAGVLAELIWEYCRHSERTLP